MNFHTKALVKCCIYYLILLIDFFFLQCSWGSKPTPPGTASTPLPPPTPSHVPGFSLSGLAEYERQMALSKMSGAHAALLHQQGQHALKQAAAMGMGALGAGYGSGFPGVATTQHLMYYQ